jgi:hypothetical protein
MVLAAWFLFSCYVRLKKQKQSTNQTFAKYGFLAFAFALAKVCF